MEPVSSTENAQEKETRERSGTAFPYYDLMDSLAVAKALYDKGGGEASKEHLAAYLKYGSVENGAFKTRLSAAKLFGLVDTVGLTCRVTERGKKALMPESHEQYKAELVDSFFSVPLFKALYEEYKGKDLPEGLGLKNALRIKFQIVPKRIDLAYRVFFDSAEAAGFFETRGGSRTQLIVPLIKPASKPPNESPENGEKDRSGGGGAGEKPPPHSVLKSREDLQNEYIATLIEVLKEKSKQGEVDDPLMERIERLLNLTSEAK